MSTPHTTAQQLETLRRRRGGKRGALTKLHRRVIEFQEGHPNKLVSFIADDFFKDLEAIKISHLALQDQIEDLVQEDDDALKAEEPERERDEENFAKVRSSLRECQARSTLWTDSNGLLEELDRALEFTEVDSPLFRSSFAELSKACRDWTKVAIAYTEDHPTFENRYRSIREKLDALSKEVHSTCRDPRPEPPADRPAPSRSTKLKLDLPTFSGHPVDWHHFHELFTSALDRAGEDYSQREKTCFLLKAMTGGEAEQIVKSHAASEDGYTKALKALKNRYGSAKMVFPHLVNKVTMAERVTFNQSGFATFRQNFLLPLQQIRELGCTDISQMIAALALSRFDDVLQDEWTKHYKTATEVPTLEDLEAFIEPLESNLRFLTQGVSIVSVASAKKPTSRTAKIYSSECSLCKEQHRLHKCPVFLGYDVERRFKYVKDKRGCTNCLSFSHSANNCNSSFTCRECDGKHHTILHRSKSTSTKTSSTTPALQASNNLMAAGSGDEDTDCSPVEHVASTHCLHTAIAKAVQDDRECDVRVALDTGATTSIITEAVASQLRLKRLPRRMIFNKGCWTEDSRYCVKLTLKSILNPDKSFTTTFQVVDRLPVAPSPVDVEGIKALPHVAGRPLADPNFGGKLDILLGGFDCAQCIVGALSVKTDTSTVTQPTIFGWTVLGPLEYEYKGPYPLQLRATEDLKDDLARIWELDRTPEAAHLSTQDEKVIQHFLDTHSRDKDGRYIVRLPRISPVPVLGNSRNRAVRRANQTESSLKKRGRLPEFQAALGEYLQLGHAEVVPHDERPRPHYYMPVHGVFKSSSTTTKVRPVFDASAPTSMGTSLNDTLHQGPNLYPQLTDILIKFRTHTIGFSADISKMFREILLHPDERDNHRFLLRDDNGRLQDLRMKRLTFGVRSSPYLATQVIRHLAEQHRDSHSEASRAILTSFYVDDYLAGAETVEEAVSLREQLCQLLLLAGMTLRKWRSSSDEFRATIPQEIIEMGDLTISSNERPIKALGLHWSVSEDSLSVSVPSSSPDQDVTKRHIASSLGKVYDILGLYAPFTVSGKIILRRLWELKIGWDEPIPDELKDAWLTWSSQLDLLKAHSVKRRYSARKTKSYQLHGFADASQDAYGAVVYLQQTSPNDTLDTAIVISKARVLPLKGLTIPRAELTAAYLLAKLMNYCAPLLGISEMTAWTDSSIVLCWLRKSPSSLKMFVGNRVKQIQLLLPDVRWRHVSSSHNPADMLSRGVSAERLLKDELWWKGPPWLNLPTSEWPTPQFQVPEVLPELRGVILTTILEPVQRPWQRFSNFDSMIRTLSWCRRFSRNLRLPPDKRTLSLHILTNECQATTNLLFKLSQEEFYGQALQLTRKGSKLPKGHVLSKHDCSIGNGGVLLINTRVRDPLNPATGKKITPLSLKSDLTKLLLNTLHRRHLHPGTNTLLAIVKENYHIPGVRNYLKGLSRRCVQCQRAYQQGTTQPMGLLPQVRTRPSAPFLHTGVDFAGPFTTKQGYTRKPILVKSYACVFICMATRAIHLELTLSLSSEDFIAALRRFCARRGCPLAMYSDNGSNFIGANEELKQIQELLRRSKTSISHYTVPNGIVWHFSPPRTPHMGGLWEAAVKQMKLLLRKLVQPHHLRPEELSSILVEIEGIINSRPLVPLDSTDPEALALTPGHFLAGRPLKSIPTNIAESVKLTSLKRWQLVQRLNNDLWESWKSSYLQALQQRQKWTAPHHKFAVNDIVLLKEDSLGYRHWPLARITKLFPGDDGVVRVVELLCGGKTTKRSTHLVIPLLKDEDENNHT